MIYDHVTVFIRNQEKARKNFVSIRLTVFPQHIPLGQKEWVMRTRGSIMKMFRIVCVTGQSEYKQPWDRKTCSISELIRAIARPSKLFIPDAHWEVEKCPQDAKNLQTSCLLTNISDRHILKSTEIWDMTWKLFKVQL